MRKDEKSKNEQRPDFVDLYHRYSDLDKGLQAALRRVATPDDLRETTAIYRLFYEARPSNQWLQVVFLLPWCEHGKEGRETMTPPFGALLAEANVNENRLFQMVRATHPLDFKLLRQMAIQIKPTLDWNKWGATLYYWNQENKRKIIEDFFYYSSTKAKKGA